MLKRVAIIVSLPVFLAAARWVPFDRLPSTCVFYQVAGYPCPSCGMTRSVMALAHLHLGHAMELNALGPLLVGFLGLWWTAAMYELITGSRTRFSEWAGRHIGLLAAIGFGILVFFGAGRIALLAGFI